MSARLVSIIGPPAAGKTTVAEWLAEALPAQLIREDYAGNPFLELAWLGRRDLALASQLYFLFSRLMQLNRKTWPASGTLVSDYGFCQDGIYASGNLPPEDLLAYRRLAERAADLVKPPDVLVHLDGGESVLLERIARRGRPHERTFTGRFLASLRQAYRQAAGAMECPVLPVDTGTENLLQEAPRSRLLARIREALGP